jgi:long-chain acyl-CoA synthetase
LKNFEGDTKPYLKYYIGGRVIREYHFHSFYEKALAFAAYLQKEHTISKGDKVAIMLGNSDFTLITYTAVLLLGAVIVPIDPDLKEEELNYILTNAQVKLLIHIQGFSLKIQNKSLLFDKLLFESLTHYKNLEIVNLDEKDIATIVYTSGTTSKPKGVVLSYKNLFANAKAIIKHHQIDSNFTSMSILPLFHVNAFNFSYFASLCAKSKLILNKNFYLPNFWKIIETQQVNVVSMVPKIVKILTQDSREMQEKPKNLRYFISAAAPLSKDLLESFYEKYNIRVLQGYGMSEAVNFSTTMPINLTDKEYEALLSEEIITIGTTIEGTDIHILDKKGQKLQASEIGELAIDSESVMSSYYNNPKASEASLKNGLLRTGDRGYYKLKNNSKYFYLTGRVKEIILKNGENIAPLELDDTLQKIEGLEQSVVVGFNNSYTGEEIGIYVVKNAKTPSSDIILQQAKKTLGEKKAPKVVVFGDSIPLTPTGKVQRLKLTKSFDNFYDVYYK